MPDAIAFLLTWVTLALAVFALRPRRTPGRHSAAHLVAAQAAQPAAPPKPQYAPAVPPPHVQERYRPLRGEDIDLVRPYLSAPSRESLDSPERQAQAYRRWELDMAARGLDVGPTTIHGVQVNPGTRHVRLAVA